MGAAASPYFNPEPVQRSHPPYDQPSDLYSHDSEGWLLSRPVNRATLELVKQFEGLRLKAYRCPAGRWTIGYGWTSGVVPGDTITADEAEEQLEYALSDIGEHVDRLIRVPLNDNQRGALISWAYNVGVNAMMASTLRDRLNRGEYAAVPRELARWTKARHPLTHTPVDLPGLKRRREAEIALWSTPENPTA